MRGSAIRCSRKRTSHAWLTASKNDRMSQSKMWFTLVPVIPTTSASSASCWPRPGRNPYENPRKSSSWIAFSTAAVAFWTILSSKAATAKGRSRPSGFGMYRRRAGRARYAPRWTRACSASIRRSRSAS